MANRAQTPNLPLNFFGFRSRTEVFRDLFPHCYASKSNAAERSIWETSCFRTIFGKALNPTVIRIKLQEQTLGRQLKFCDKGFKRSRHGSLHATLPIDLAVETSQPQFVRPQRYRIATIFTKGNIQQLIHSSAHPLKRSTTPPLNNSTTQ